MKKIILSIAFIGLMTMAYSQAKVELGLKGGINASSLSGGVGDNITAFHGGAYTLVKITKIGIQAEGLFSKRGTDKVDMSYLDVPILLKFYVVGGLNFYAGPQFGIVLNKDAKADDGTNINSYFEDSDLSAAVGAGVDLPFGLNVTARYLIGLKDINTLPNEESKSNTFQLSVGYRLFKLGN